MRRDNAAARQREAYRAVVRSLNQRRDLGAPVRDSFFHSTGSIRHPLASLMSSRSGPGGGRGGRTRVALYLSLLWVAAGGDHSSERPASFWAELLGLSDPDGAGSRVVRSTWRELETRGFVTLTPGDQSGAVPTVRLLREDGSRKEYSIPAGEGGDTYRRVPQSAWQHLLHEADLTGAGLAMYLVALRLADRAQRVDRLVFPASYIRDEYGLGESTRKSGLRNLVDLGVLDPMPARLDEFGDMGRARRRRYVYDVMPEYVDPRPTTQGKP